LKARRQLGIPLNAPDLKEMAQAVLASSHTTIEIFRSILEKLFTAGWNPTKKKRTNSLWDMQVVFSAGEEFEHDSSKLHVVTADGGILAAAEAVGLRRRATARTALGRERIIFSKILTFPPGCWSFACRSRTRSALG
jgi:hypothetical protein